MDTIPGMYSIGQYVYTAKDIKNWFDFSIKDHVPANTIGRVGAYIRVGKTTDTVIYEIIFDNEFGRLNVRHNDLKLG